MTFPRLKSILIVMVFFAFAASLAQAQVPSTKKSGITHEAFTADRFAALQAADEYVLLDIFADWCPTCAKQQKVLNEFSAKYPDAPLTILQINFDDQKNWVTHFKAPRQSTMILYRGDEQLWFSVAETKKKKIFAALEQVLEADKPGTVGN